MDDKSPETADRASLTPATFVRRSLMEALVAGQRSGPPVEHPGWTQARTSLLTEIADGPSLLALLGPPGTGKTWLLRTILADVQQCGRTAAIMSGGILPFEFAPGKVVLLDDATKMDAESLAPLGMLCGVTIVLAGRPELADCLGHLPTPPVIVPLASMSVEYVPRFVARWLETHALPADAADEAAIARFFAHSEGVPRAVVRLLRASLVMAAHRGWTHVGASCVDEVAALREAAPDALLAAWPVADPRSRAEAASPVPAARLPVPVAMARTLRAAANAFSDVASIRRAGRAGSGFAIAALGAAVLLWGLLSSLPVVQPDRKTAEVLAPGTGSAVKIRNPGDSAVATAPDSGSIAINARDRWTEADVASLAPDQESARSQMQPMTGPASLQDPAQAAPSNVSGMAGQTNIGQGARVSGDSAAAAVPGLPQVAALAGEVKEPAPLQRPPSVALAVPPDRAALSVPAQPGPEADAAAPGEIEGPTRLDRPGATVQQPADFTGELVFLASPKETSAWDEVRPPPDVIAAEHDEPLAPIDIAAGSPPGDVVSPERSASIAQTSHAQVQSQTTAMTSTEMTPRPQEPEPSDGTAPAVSAAAMHAPSGAANRGAPGLALIVQAGDTMPVLYARIYRGLRPPPYAEFIAANRGWSGRGGIVVFPAPADGWTQN